MRKPMTDEQIAEIKARVAAATTGPWTIETGGYTGNNWMLGWSMQKGADVCITTDHVHASELGGADVVDDANFIAHARSDIPALLAEVERLRAQLKTAKDDYDKLMSDARAVSRVRDDLERELGLD